MVRKKALAALLSLGLATQGSAQTPPDVQALNDEKNRYQAQADRDNAQANAINAQTAIVKAKAAANQADSDAAAALVKSQMSVETAKYDALKGTFGAPPSVGNDGTVAVTDGGSTVLLQIRKGSFDATVSLAGKLCAELRAGGITKAFIAPKDLDSKIQSSRFMLREFYDLDSIVRQNQSNSQVKLQIGAVAVLGALSLLEYGAGALQSVTKLFRSDYSAAVSSDPSRVEWLEYIAAAKCPDILEAQVEQKVRGQAIGATLERLNAMLSFTANVTAAKTANKNDLDNKNARLAAAQKQNGTPPEVLKSFQDEVDKAVAQQSAIAQFDPVVTRIQALFQAIQQSPGTFLDAITWGVFADPANALALSTKSRLIVYFTTQDSQITSTFWLTGKSLYGKSAGELAYRAFRPDGSLALVGYLTASASTGKIDLSEKAAGPADASLRLPVSAPPTPPANAGAGSGNQAPVAPAIPPGADNPQPTPPPGR